MSHPVRLSVFFGALFKLGRDKLYIGHLPGLVYCDMFIVDIMMKYPWRAFSLPAFNNLRSIIFCDETRCVNSSRAPTRSTSPTTTGAGRHPPAAASTSPLRLQPEFGARNRHWRVSLIPVFGRKRSGKNREGESLWRQRGLARRR